MWHARTSLTIGLQLEQADDAPAHRQFQHFFPIQHPQAEHGSGLEQAVLVSTDEKLFEAVEKAFVSKKKNTSTGVAGGCHFTGIALCSSLTRQTRKYDLPTA